MSVDGAEREQASTYYTAAVPVEVKVITVLEESAGMITSREGCGWASASMSYRILIFSHMASNDLAEMRWHLRSTCQVTWNGEQESSLLNKRPVVEPEYVTESAAAAVAFQPSKWSSLSYTPELSLTMWYT